MKTIKYLFLGLFMAAFTACIVSSCKDDNDESNQSRGIGIATLTLTSLK